MGAYIIRRLILIIPTLLLVTIIVFLLVRFIPGAVLSHKGKRLGCYCHEWDGKNENPLYCHVDNIADYLNSIPD